MKTATLFALTALLAIGGKAPADDFDPFSMSKEYFAASVRTIALAPLIFPAGTENQEKVGAILEAAIRVRLEEMRYTVVPSQIFGRQWVDFSTKLGGVYDPVTGETRDEVWKTAYEYTTRALRDSHDVDAVAYPAVTVAALSVISPLDLAYSAANNEGLRWKGMQLPVHLYNRPQLVLGNHLAIRIIDLNGERMYGVRYPIEVTVTFVAGSYEEKPQSERFKNPTWINKAAKRITRYLPKVDR